MLRQQTYCIDPIHDYTNERAKPRATGRQVLGAEIYQLPAMTLPVAHLIGPWVSRTAV